MWCFGLRETETGRGREEERTHTHTHTTHTCTHTHPHTRMANTDITSGWIRKPILSVVSQLSLTVCVYMGVHTLVWGWTEVLMFPPPLKLVADLISLLTLNIAGSLILLYMCKAIVNPAGKEYKSLISSMHFVWSGPKSWRLVVREAAKRDLECVDSHATLFTLPMTLMSMSLLFHRYGAGEAAVGIWAGGVGLHVVLLVLFMALHILPRIRHGVPWDEYQVLALGRRT